jgi:hypothetical protein
MQVGVQVVAKNHASGLQVAILRPTYKKISSQKIIFVRREILIFVCVPNGSHPLPRHQLSLLDDGLCGNLLLIGWITIFT